VALTHFGSPPDRVYSKEEVAEIGIPALKKLTADMVNHPPHYTQYGIEVIEITEKLGFCLGNVVKYILRADFKGKRLEDLKKALWYLERAVDTEERKRDAVQS
jgi:hypothetical protein